MSKIGPLTKHSLKFWISVVFIWLLSTVLDRLWWHNFTGLPSWDQADYLNSALDHGRALGVIQGGAWKGWDSLLDLSPKIPPLASLINGSVIAIAGDSPQQAAWSLSLWNGLLLVSVAAWSLKLRGTTLALMSTAFVALTPALLEIRSDYVLEMPLTAVITFTLWRLGCWSDPTQGGKWGQAMMAAFACTAAILIKQSSLLVLIPSVTWAVLLIFRHRKYAFFQLLAGCFVVAVGVLPWLRHNWITTIGGTNRAVFESAAREGDPSILSLENWIWYPRLLPDQVGTTLLIIGISGIFLWFLMRRKSITPLLVDNTNNDDKLAWEWLIVVLIAGWILTSISPNKGDRYITPLLPPLIICLTRGWIQWGLWTRSLLHRSFLNRFSLPFILTTGLLTALSTAYSSQISLLGRTAQGPLEEIVKVAGGASPNNSPRTLIVIPSTPDLNQHNVSYFGRRNGGNLVGRQLGSSASDIGPLLSYAQWIVLAEGDQGSVRASAALVDEAVRISGFFEKIQTFPRKNGGSYSLWQRHKDAPPQKKFSENFNELATGLSTGPNGLAAVFSEIAVHHMLDGHMEYRIEVRKASEARLKVNPTDTDAWWSLALLETLANRPTAAAEHFKKLEDLLPENSWPSTYRTLVTMASWNPWLAASVARKAQTKFQNPVLEALGHLSEVLGGAIWRLPAASHSIPKAIQEIENALELKAQVDLDSDQASN